ncbi:MAG: GldG family protein [Treponema sp.]|nr:GldG family protein [Treponema sp.]
MKEIKGLKNIRESFRTRQFRYGGYAALITLAVIVGLILLNLIVGQFSPYIDMTESGLFSLTEQTLQVVDAVKSPVNFYGLWRPGEEYPELPQIIDLYLARNRNIRLELVDPNRNPGLLARFDRANQGIPNGSLIVEGEKGFKVITPNDFYDFMDNYQNNTRSVTGLAMERRITAALLFVATGQTPVIYEVTGHQETLLADLGLQTMVERENFSVRQINLMQSPIPDDASILLLNAPYSDLTQLEAERILNYLDKGGRLMILADLFTGDVTMINEVLASYGFRLDYGYLVENDIYHTGGAPYLVFPDMADHDITNPLVQQRTPVLIYNGMGMSELEAKRRTVELKPLLSSSAISFLRIDLLEDTVDQIASDIRGPITIGMTATDPSWVQGDEPQTRIVAVASGALLATYQYAPGNMDFFLNSITWLQDRPETLSVRSKSMFLLPMMINAFLINLYGVIIVIVIPVGFFIAGFVIWLRRRHL